MSNFTNELTIENTEYVFRTRVDWFRLQSVPDKSSLIVLVDANEELEDATQLMSDDTQRVEVVDNTANYYKKLLTLYLMSFEIDGKMLNLTQKRLTQIDPRHVPLLIKEAEKFYNEQLKEIGEFEGSNPT